MSACVLILFQMTCKSAWLRCFRPLPNYVLRTGVAWRDVPAETVGCSGATAWRRLRDWTEAGVRPRLHTALLTE